MANVSEEAVVLVGVSGLDWFFEVIDGDIRAVLTYKEVVRQALVNLSAIAAPAGLMPGCIRCWLAWCIATRSSRSRFRRRF